MKDRLSGGFSDIVSQQKGQVFATDPHRRTQTFSSGNTADDKNSLQRESVDISFENGLRFASRGQKYYGVVGLVGYCGFICRFSVRFRIQPALHALQSDPAGSEQLCRHAKS